MPLTISRQGRVPKTRPDAYVLSVASGLVRAGAFSGRVLGLLIVVTPWSESGERSPRPG